jgi:AcrR family transcriptional regulator
MNDAAKSARARRSASRQDELLQAAEELFREKGVAATTISEVTERAGVAKGTFYLYFGSKDHIVAGLNERLISGQTALIVEAIERLADEDFFTLADEFVATIIDYWIEHRIREAREASAPLVARALRMSARTMSRKLNQEGTTFADELENVRRELALSYVCSSERPFAEIAYLLGFSHVESFLSAVLENSVTAARILRRNSSCPMSLRA